MPPKGHKITWSPDLTGYVVTAANVGTGDGQVFRDEVPPGTLNLKTLKDGTGIDVVNNADDITINNTLPENTTVSNVGTGAGLVYRDRTGDQLNLKTIKAGANISVTNNADDITIANTAPAAPTKTETEVLLMAGAGVPLNAAPYNAAPVRLISMAPNNQAFQAVEFSPPGGAGSAYAWNISTRWIAKPGTAFYIVNGQINAFCDNASLNNISFEISHYSQSYPAYNYDLAPAVLAPVIVAATGQYISIRFNFQFTIAGDLLGLVVARAGAGDLNPGLVYVPNVLLYFNQGVS